MRNIPALIAFIEGRHAVRHDVSRAANDCIAFALGATEAQTGIRVAPKLTWSTLAEGARILKRYGGIEAALDAHFDRVPPSLAQRGDIAGVPDADFGIHPMIVEGATLVGPGDDGNRRQPRAAMTCAWSAITVRSAPRKTKKKPSPRKSSVRLSHPTGASNV